MTRIGPPLSAAGSRVLRHTALRQVALGIARMRARSIVLVYHRLGPDGRAAHEVVPSLRTDLFRRQLEALGNIGDIVPLAELLQPPESVKRTRFAITFDDDEPSHVRHALPVLQALGVQATFFLSGRALHGLPPYWWMVLEQAVVETGLPAVCREVGIVADTAKHLAAQLEGSPLVDRVAGLVQPNGDVLLSTEGIEALVGGGMTIGFHTLRHPVLTTLDDVALERALREGLAELSTAAGAPVNLLAYPHGRASTRVAIAARTAAFRAAFRSGRRPMRHDTDAFLLGRWEPGALEPDELIAHVALRLNYPTGGPPR
jgi:peptidoglycan/xylan/chitin deacetylase (PgdA/CDA1 family)